MTAQATFELWDTETVNVLGNYPTKDAALAYVQRVLSRHGRAAASTWELVRVLEDRDAATVAQGDDLADLADRVTPRG